MTNRTLPTARLSRRQLLRSTAAAAAAGWSLCRTTAGAPAAATTAPSEPVSFFLVGDTHYYADKAAPDVIDPASAATNGRLIGWLNRLPGTVVPAGAGGRTLPVPRGVIHAGDLIDSGDKGNGPVAAVQQATELAAFTADWGLNGGDGRLKWPAYEVHGNHDGPRGDGPVVPAIVARNAKRRGLAAVSDNGLHYAWTWGGVHFLNLGIVVGGGPQTARARRYDPKGSLAFLEGYLAKHVGDSGAPVVLTHHVDVARYSTECTPDLGGNPEWDPCDARAYHAAIGRHNVAAILFGHTHARRIARWDGTPKPPAGGGVWAFNTDNAGHFKSRTQAVLHFAVGPTEMVVREFATADAWETGDWTKQVWRFKPARGG